MKKKTLAIGSAIIAGAAIAGAVLAFASPGKRVSALSCAGACSGCGGCGFKASSESSYYTDRADGLMKEMHKRQGLFRSVLAGSYSAEEMDAICAETDARFLELIPGLPYIGGEANGMSEDVEGAGMALAFYRTMKSRGVATPEIGRLIGSATKEGFERAPRWLVRLYGARFFTSRHIDESRKSAARSLDRKYPCDWVTVFVEGDGERFDYGFDHIECGVQKYLAANGASDLTPYLCALDFVYSDYLGEGLVRKGTLATGSDRCDFRLKRE